MTIKRNPECEASIGVVHVTFGTAHFIQSLFRLRRSARRFGIDDVRVYHPAHTAVRRATEENRQIFWQPRGAGYWLWKPYILLDTIDKVQKGTIIIYTDAGHRYIGDPFPLIAPTATRDIVLFHNNDHNLQRHWTKRDCFTLMQADTPEYWDALQLDASIQVYRAGETARSFLVELLAAMRDARVLTDEPNVCGLPNLEGFRDHRHDQSILTILATKHRIETFPSPKIVVKTNRATERQSRIGPTKDHLPKHRDIVFEHHRLRTSWVIGYLSSMLRVVSKLGR
jgi:hypothetical protein